MPAEAKVGISIGLQGVDELLQQLGMIQAAVGGLGGNNINPWNTMHQTGQVAHGSYAGDNPGASGLPSAGMGIPVGSQPVDTITPIGGNTFGAGGTITISQVHTLTVTSAAVVNVYGSGAGSGGGSAPAGAPGAETSVATSSGVSAVPEPALGAGNGEAAVGAGVLGGMSGLLGGFGAGFGIYELLNLATKNLAITQNQILAGGSVRPEEFDLQRIGSIPLIGGMITSLVGPQIEKGEQAKDLLDAQIMMGLRDMVPGSADYNERYKHIAGGMFNGPGLSPLVIQEETRLALRGMRLPHEISERLNEEPEITVETSPGGWTTNRFGLREWNPPKYENRQNPRWLSPGLQSVYTSAYEKVRSSSAMMAEYGYDDLPETVPNPRTGQMERVSVTDRLAGTALAQGDYETAMSLYGLVGNKEGLSRVRERAQQTANRQAYMQLEGQFGQAETQIRQRRSAEGLSSKDIDELFAPMPETGSLGGAGVSDASVFSRHAAGGSFAAERTWIKSQIEDLNVLIRQSRDDFQQAKDPATRLAAQQRTMEYEQQRRPLETRLASQQTEMAQTPVSIDLQRGMSATEYETRVLETIPGSYGNIRGALERQFGLQQQEANQIVKMRDAQRSQGGMTEQAEFTYQQRLQELGMQQASTFQQLSTGWESRLISTVMNQPGNINLDGRFSYRDAVLAGVTNPHFGATMGQLPAFLQMQNIVGGPIGYPGQAMPFSGSGTGVYGMSWLGSGPGVSTGAGSGVLGAGWGMSALPPLLPVQPGSGPIGAGGSPAGTGIGGPGGPSISAPAKKDSYTPSPQRVGETAQQYQERISFESYIYHRDEGVPNVAPQVAPMISRLPLGPSIAANPTRTPSAPSSKDAVPGADGKSPITIKVEVTLKDQKGNVLGRGDNVTNGGGDLASNLSSHGVEDMLSQMGVWVAQQ